jgi:hypothetical protein
VSAYISLPQVTGGHLAQLTGGGGGVGEWGGCMFVSSGPFSAPTHTSPLGFGFYTYQFGFGISQQRCIPLGLLVPSILDAFAVAVAAVEFLQIYSSTKLLNEYGP